MRQGDRVLGIGDQTVFAWRAVARSVARIFGENHAQPEPGEHCGIERAVSGMPRIAMKDDDRGARRFGRLGYEAPERIRRRPGAKSA